MQIFIESQSPYLYNDDKPSWKGPKRYGCFSFLFDIIMVGLTGGLWLIWIFAREMRKRA